ncbi:unnamed protein product [Parnassius mnemosyne]|uniref:Reverse transcriptase domain-containing protein n=1 Tax=Parnassius mnemosyne TaxID=213953 RepID=A0AAV1KB38_9NEOP
MHKLMSALCPDDSTDCYSPYHRQVRMLAAVMPSGGAAPPLKVEELGGIVKALPNTAPGLDGVSARIVRNVWNAAPREFHSVYAKCVEEGVLPNVWKDGRLIVIPKGNDKPLTDVKAYRPITLLPVLGKLLERVILRCAPAISREISEYQHGFSPGAVYSNSAACTAQHGKVFSGMLRASNILRYLWRLRQCLVADDDGQGQKGWMSTQHL